MEKWNKYTYLNTDTDSLIEISKIDGSGESLLFTLNNSPYVLLSVVDVTINTTTTEKEVAPMDQATVNATSDFLRGALAKSTLLVGELKEHIQKVTQQDYKTAGELQGVRDSMHEWAVAELESLGINQEQAEQIAEICGFELSTEVEVEVTVVYNLTLQIPAGEDAEDVISEIDFDAITYDTDKIVNVYSSVDNINI